MTSASTFSDPHEQPSATQALPEELLNLPRRPSSLEIDDCILHGKRPLAGQVVVFNSQQALNQIVSHSESNMRSELGGVLLGHVYRDADTVFVDIQAAIPAVSNDSGPVHFTFTADAWRQIHLDRNNQYPTLDIVGWFHTHPALSVFYSSDDVVVHSAAFTLPWHVGLVVDPVRHEAAYFGWCHGNLDPIAGFYEYRDLQKQSVIRWRAVRTSVYHLSEAELGQNFYEDDDLLDESGSMLAGMSAAIDARRKPAWLPLSPSANYLGLILGLVALALLLFLLLFWVMPKNRQIQQLQETVLALANNEQNPNVAMCTDSRLRPLLPQSGATFATNSTVDVIGTAVYPDAYRYRVEIRPTGETQWALVGSTRQQIEFGQLASWNTTGLLPGLYDMRLTAVDRNAIRLANSPDCVIQVDLRP